MDRAELAALRAETAALGALLADIQGRHAGLMARLAALEEAPVAADADSATALLVAVKTGPVDALCDHLEALDRQLKQAGVGIDPAEVAFLSRARAVLAGAGPALVTRLGDLLRFCDALGVYAGSAYRPLHIGLAEARRLLQGAGAELPPTLREVPLPVLEPVSLPGGLVLVPGAAPDAVARAVWGLLDECWSALRVSYRKSLRDDVVHALGERLRGDAPAWSESLRPALNLHTRHLERADTPAVQAAGEALRAQGVRTYALAVGERWDPDRHDPKRFERVTRPGNAPAGSVLAVRQLGLAGADGLPIQRCIVVTCG